MLTIELPKAPDNARNILLTPMMLAKTALACATPGRTGWCEASINVGALGADLDKLSEAVIEPMLAQLKKEAPPMRNWLSDFCGAVEGSDGRACEVRGMCDAHARLILRLRIIGPA